MDGTGGSKEDDSKRQDDSSEPLSPSRESPEDQKVSIDSSVHSDIVVSSRMV